MTKEFKESIKEKLIQSLSPEKEVAKIVLFGSFIHSDEPHDIDIAIFQTSGDKYLELALKYRRLTRKISKKIPLDILPIRSDVESTSFLNEIEAEEVIYER